MLCIDIIHEYMHTCQKLKPSLRVTKEEKIYNNFCQAVIFVSTDDMIKYWINKGIWYYIYFTILLSFVIHYNLCEKWLIYYLISANEKGSRKKIYKFIEIGIHLSMYDLFTSF